MGTGHTYLDNGAIIIGRDSRRGQDLCDDQRGRHWPQLGSGSPLHVWPEPAAQSVLNPGLRKQATAGGFSRVVGTSGARTGIRGTYAELPEVSADESPLRVGVAVPRSVVPDPPCRARTALGRGCAVVHRRGQLRPAQGWDTS